MVTGFETLPFSCLHHDFILMNLTCTVGNNGLIYGKSYWKFNDEILNDNDFVASFELFWMLISRTDNIT